MLDNFRNCYFNFQFPFQFSVREKPRAWHVAGIHPTQCEVVVTGGNKHERGHTGPRRPVSDTCTLLLGKTYTTTVYTIIVLCSL